jgi:N-acetyl-anhydromuramyl-L-alanine amidase AmpD
MPFFLKKVFMVMRNSVLKVGSRGDDVVMLQSLLLGKGYKISTDGIFGHGTEDIVIDFQRKNNLTADGIVGKSTWSMLVKTNGDTNKKINDTKFVLTEKNYYNEIYPKKAIVLHHTNGWTVRKGTNGKPSMNHFYWWASQDKHVSTAYSIDYKGNIYEHFDPNKWAYHIGLGLKKNYLDKESIAIELVNEGQMIKKNGQFFWMSGDVALPYNRPNDEPVYVEEKWRGYNYFAPYSAEQMESLNYLVNHLCDEFGIERNFIADNDYHPELVGGNFEGIYNHANIRKYGVGKPKHDLSPAFDFESFKKELV